MAARLTHERLQSYLAVESGDIERAVALYEWNSTAAGAVLGVVGTAEVVVRNALDERLRAWSKARHREPRWFDTVPLDSRGRADVARAVARATRFGHQPESGGRVVAELSLGFWRYLLGTRYLTSLWVPALHAAFPQGPTDLRVRRRQVERHLDRLHFLRNRVAHHEPVHRRDLLADHRAAVELIGWICPDSAAWLAACSTVEEVVGRRPPPSGPFGGRSATASGPACRSGSG